MAYEFILVEKEEGVGFITLNRPEKLNAMNRALTTELYEAMRELNNDDEVGCIVLTGSGHRAFSAGGDIHEQRERDRELSQEERDRQDAIRSRGAYEIGASPKPTIGMMNGLALWRRRRAVLLAGHAGGLPPRQLPVSGGGLRAD